MITLLINIFILRPEKHQTVFWMLSFDTIPTWGTFKPSALSWVETLLSSRGLACHRMDFLLWFPLYLEFMKIFLSFWEIAIHFLIFSMVLLLFLTFSVKVANINTCKPSLSHEIQMISISIFFSVSRIHYVTCIFIFIMYFMSLLNIWL